MFPSEMMGVPQADPKGTHTQLYDTLNVSYDATPSDIKKAFRRKSVQHHPDKGGNSSKYQEITHAYDILGDTFKKAVYDDYGEDGLESDMLKAVIQRKMKKQLEPVKVHVKVELNECLTPPSKWVTFRRIVVKNGNMTTENASVRIDLPVGITHGQIINVNEQGNFIENSKTDLLCCIDIAEHPLFKVQGFELIVERNISFVSAMLGCVYTVPTLDDPNYPVVIPPLCVFRDPVRMVENKGLPVKTTGIRGALHIKFKVDYDKVENIIISKELGILLRDELFSFDNEQVGGTIQDHVMNSAQKTLAYNSREVDKRMELARSEDTETEEQSSGIPRGMPMGIPMNIPFPYGNAKEVQCATQ